MTEWFKCSNIPAPPRDLLVWGVCGMPHVANWDYGNHCHTESCIGIYHAPGNSVEFTHWAELPAPPDQESYDTKEHREKGGKGDD